jgi:hypothetical protein
MVPNVRYGLDTIQTLDHILSQMNPTHILAFQYHTTIYFWVLQLVSYICMIFYHFILAAQ